MTRTLRTARLPALFALLSLVGLAACGGEDAETMPAEEAVAVAPQDAFWENLQGLCESAAHGDLLQAPDDQIDPDADLLVHFWECGDEEIRFPLHVDDNRSRTWVFIRHDDHLELRHDHRNPDGTEEDSTWYGDTTMEEGTANRQEFASMRGEVRAGWAVEIEPGVHFTYGTMRDGEFRHHLRFDLTREAELPPMHWGHDVRPSQRP
jgi:hypothetical protein